MIKLLKIGLIICEVIIVLIFYAVCLLGEGGNHTGVDTVLYGYAGIIIGTVYFAIAAKNNKLNWEINGLNNSIFLIAIIAGVSILVFDYFNIMVEYEEWLKRGQPSKPFFIG